MSPIGMSRIGLGRREIASKGFLRALVAPILVACALLIVSGAPEHRNIPFSYSIIDLGTLGGNTSIAFDINELGHVCGGADVANGDRHGFFWKDGVMTDLGTLGHTQSEAHGINNLDQVVGISSNTGNTAKAFIWQNGQISDLPPTNIFKSAYGINDAGQIVGQFIAPGGNKHAYILQSGVLTDLGTLGGTTSLALDVNAHGDACGRSFTAAPGQHAVVWTSGLPVDLGGSSATEINDAGDIVGDSSSDSNLASHAVIWHFQVEAAVPGLDGCAPRSTGEGLNNLGEVVGDCRVINIDQGYIYSPNSGTYLLINLLFPSGDWSWLLPRGINDSGQIVGVGGIGNWPHAFLMTRQPPIPAFGASGAALLTILVCILGAFLARRAPASR